MTEFSNNFINCYHLSEWFLYRRFAW